MLLVWLLTSWRFHFCEFTCQNNVTGDFFRDELLKTVLIIFVESHYLGCNVMFLTRSLSAHFVCQSLELLEKAGKPLAVHDMLLVTDLRIS